MTIQYPIENPHALSSEEVLQAFQTDADTGIGLAEAESRLNTFGLNAYHRQKQKSIGRMLLQQFESPIVYLLMVGAVVSFYFRDVVEAIAILAVVLINALIGFFMELQARSSMNALRAMDVILSNVLREGKTVAIPSERLTPGDVVVLEAGDVVPGDGRLIASNQLQCDESSLTGESLPSEKNTEKLPKDTALADQQNMVFKGTAVINGTGKAVITGIAQNTQLGTISALVAQSLETTTPLDKKINALSKKLIWIMLVMTGIFALTGFLQGKAWVLIVETSIALAVAAFPEGLPIVATVALANGMLLMAKRNAIVKELSSVETLGSTNVILTDKTGTLTENKIFVEMLAFPEERLAVHIAHDKLLFTDGAVEKSAENFKKLCLIGVLCNNSAVEAPKGGKKALGDPIEIALVLLAKAAELPVEATRKQYARMAEMPFSSDTKIMGTLHKSPNGHLVAAKGSVEHLLKECGKIQTGATIRALKEADRKAILSESESMASNGLRVLAFAFKEATSIGADHFLEDLVYVGMVGFLDPPRLDIKAAIAACRKAGIKIVMITGDHPMTALNIAQQTGLVDDGAQNVIIGKDLPPMEALTKAWSEKILQTAVFARATPKQKLDITAVYQKAGNIVAMIGDGVNDAPAIKKADIGIAMGLRGTPVAKETASIILKDDSFNSVAKAVAQGRVIFKNIQKFVVYLISCNLSEIFVVTVLGFITPASTLLPLQILFLNMVTDIFPALALGLGKGEKTVMDVPPRDPEKLIISNRRWMAIAAYAFVMTLAVILAVLYCQRTISADAQLLNNVAFITLAFAQLFHVFNMSSADARLLVNDITKNKFIWMALFLCSGLMLLVFCLPQSRLVLDLAVLPGKVWLVSILASVLPLFLIQVFKSVWGRKRLRAR